MLQPTTSYPILVEDAAAVSIRAGGGTHSASGLRHTNRASSSSGQSIDGSQQTEVNLISFWWSLTSRHATKTAHSSLSPPTGVGAAPVRGRGLQNLEFGIRVQGSRFRVQGSGFRVQGSGFRVSGFRVQGSGFRVQGSSPVRRCGLLHRGLGFRIYDSGLGSCESRK